MELPDYTGDVGDYPSDGESYQSGCTEDIEIPFSFTTNTFSDSPIAPVAHMHPRQKGAKRLPDSATTSPASKRPETRVDSMFSMLPLRPAPHEDILGSSSQENTVPDYMHAYLAGLPDVAKLYNTLCDVYVDKTSDNAIRMGLAKAFAFALLSHYYPSSEGYEIDVHPLPPMASKGLNFILRNARNDWPRLSNPVPRTDRLPAPSKGEMRWLHCIQYHTIEAEDIAVLVVRRKSLLTKTQYLPHTFFAIMADVLDYKTLSKANPVLPSDILTDLMCSVARIQEGYGFTLHGTRLGFYKYNAGEPWYEGQTVDSNSTGGHPAEPKAEPIYRGKCDVAVELRDTSLVAVADVFGSYIGGKDHEVRYMDGIGEREGGHGGAGVREKGKEAEVHHEQRQEQEKTLAYTDMKGKGRAE